MNFTESLKDLGLNEKEAKVYLALLQSGRATAYTIAARSGIKKATTYLVLGQLVEKGFVLNAPRAKKQQFVAVSPQKCIETAKEKIETLERELPELLALEKKQDEKVSVAYFEGIGGVKEAYNRLIKHMKKKPMQERQYVGFYAKTDNLDSDLERYFTQMSEDLFQKNGIKRKAITTYNELIAKKYLNPAALKKYNTESKALYESKYSSYVSIEIYDNFVQILSQRTLQTILIEDADIANTQRQIFEMMWDLVDKDKENYVKFSSVGGAEK